jgi:4-amino-4-deoxy-L-arabinose transferase-like glycosyltransferase
MQNVAPVENCCEPTRAAARWRWPLFVGFVAVVLFILRQSAPPNLLDQDQENPGAYVLDAVKNGHWICQRDLTGEITSKPPLYTWIAGLATVACGRISLFTLYLPGALALLGTALLVFVYGRDAFGERAALLGALACMLCPAGFKEFGLARTDGVFAFTVTAATFLAYDAWQGRRGWTPFWLMSAGATLTKGPLGVVLAAAGLLASFWEKRSDEPLRVRGSHWAGVMLFLVLTVGWLGLAYAQVGRALLDKLFLQELVFHVVQGEQKKTPGTQFYLSPLYYLARSAPWSLLAYYGLWRLWHAPASAVEERRFERFLSCWFGAGLLLFSLAPHQRGDLLWPIMPAGALIAGREVARLTTHLKAPAFERFVFGMVAFAVIGFSIYYFGPHAWHPLVRQTVALRTFAEQIERQGGRDLPLVHTDDPAALQIYLDTYRLPVPLETVATLLRGKSAVAVAVTDWTKLQALLNSGVPPVYTLLEQNGPVAEMNVRIVSNRPSLRME